MRLDARPPGSATPSSAPPLKPIPHQQMACVLCAACLPLLGSMSALASDFPTLLLLPPQQLHPLSKVTTCCAGAGRNIRQEMQARLILLLLCLVFLSLVVFTVGTLQLSQSWTPDDRSAAWAYQVLFALLQSAPTFCLPPSVVGTVPLPLHRCLHGVFITTEGIGGEACSCSRSLP